MIAEAELEALVGRAIPGGVYTVEPYIDWLVNDVVGGTADHAIAHPLFAYVAVARGKGLTWEQLFAICGADASDGPMFGEHETEIFRPLRVGERLTVSGEFVSAVRKTGRRTGVFDVIGFRMDLADELGERTATTYNSIVYPRRRP